MAADIEFYRQARVEIGMPRNSVEAAFQEMESRRTKCMQARSNRFGQSRTMVDQPETLQRASPFNASPTLFRLKA